MSKARYIGVRALQTLPSMLVVTLISFLLLRAAPGDPARVVAGPRASDATIAAVRQSLGLDRPSIVQYGLYLSHAVRGDFGYNLAGSSTVTSIVASGAVVTAWLTVTSLLLTVLIAIPLAVFAARKPNGIADTLARTFSVGGMALPSYWVAIMLITHVALPTGWFPVGGWPQGFSARLNAIFLPALTLAISLSPLLVRSLRSSLLEVLGSDYVLSARSSRVSRSRLLGSYVLRNAALPAIPLVAIIVGFLLGGTVVVESAYNLPGLGQFLVQAVSNGDANVVQGIVLVLGWLILLVYLAADILVTVVDPRATIR